jgi:hypothetical protein
MKLTQEGLLEYYGGYTYSMEAEIEANYLDTSIILTTGEEITGQEFLDRYFSPEEEYDKSNDEDTDWNYYESIQ